MLDEVEPDAPDYRDFVCSHGAEEPLYRRDFRGHSCGGGEDVVVGDGDDVCLQASFFGCSSDVEGGGGEDGLAAEEAAVGGLEPDEAFPGGHGDFGGRLLGRLLSWDCLSHAD